MEHKAYFCEQIGPDRMPTVDRREVSRVFRARLSEAMARAGVSQAALARRVGISRSTLAQLLSTEVNRRPRAGTVAAVATELKVSLDWLLGLSQVDKLGADILHESLQVAPNAQHPVDSQSIAWFEEAAGAKIRYVPGTLPVFAKTGDVLRHEYGAFSARSIDRALVEAREKLVRLRVSETDMEVCMPMQGIEAFAQGAGSGRRCPLRRGRSRSSGWSKWWRSCIRGFACISSMALPITPYPTPSTVAGASCSTWARYTSCSTRQSTSPC